MAQAIVRLGYLRPDVVLQANNDIVNAEWQGDLPISPSDILYQVYREKIYQESLPMRELMYRSILS